MRRLTTTLIIATLAVPAFAGQHTTPGLKMAQQAFQMIPGAESGSVDVDAVLSYGADVRVSMDSNQDGKVELKEFTSWGFGMQNLAEDVDREAAFETALRVVHAAWDINGDGAVSAPEHAHSLSADFIRSDQDGDGLLTSEEFLEGFLIMRAMRAAIRDSSDTSAH